MKPKQERFTKEIEASIDAEFAKIGINTLYVCYMRAKQAPMIPKQGTSCAVTVVSTDEIDSDKIVSAMQDIEQELERSPSGTYAPHYMFQNMRKRGFPGIAICSCSDRFKLREGRIRAKRHLLSHLMHQPHIIITLDKHGALYPVSPIIHEVPQVQDVMITESDAKKPIHTLDDAVGVEEQELRIKLAWLERTSDAVERRLGDRANKMVAMDRTIVALRKDVDDRDKHVAELQQTIVNSREAVTTLELDVERCRASRGRAIETMVDVVDDVKKLRRDVADRNALIKEQGDTLRRFRAMRHLPQEEPKTDVLMREQRFYFDGPLGDPVRNTVDPLTSVADSEIMEDVVRVGGTTK